MPEFLWFLDPYNWMAGKDADKNTDGEDDLPQRVHYGDPYHWVLTLVAVAFMVGTLFWGPASFTIGAVLMILEIILLLGFSPLPVPNGLFVRRAFRRPKMFMDTRPMDIPGVTQVDLIPGDAEVTITMNGDEALASYMRLDAETAKKLLENNPSKAADIVADTDGEVFTTPVALDLTLVVRLAVHTAPWAAVRTFLPDFQRNPNLEIGPMVRAKAMRLIISTCDEVLQDYNVAELRTNVEELNKALLKGLQESLLLIGVHVTAVKIDASRGIYFDQFDQRINAIQARQTAEQVALQDQKTRQAQADADALARITEATRQREATEAEAKQNQLAQTALLDAEKVILGKQNEVALAEKDLAKTRALRDLQATMERLTFMKGQTYETVLRSLLDSLVGLKEEEKTQIVKEFAASIGKTPQTVVSLGGLDGMYQLVALLRPVLENHSPALAAMLPTTPPATP